MSLSDRYSSRLLLHAVSEHPLLVALTDPLFSHRQFPDLVRTLVSHNHLQSGRSIAVVLPKADFATVFRVEKDIRDRLGHTTSDKGSVTVGHLLPFDSYPASIVVTIPQCITHEAMFQPELLRY
ncbi:hypothetical protein KIPB_010893, partial [Kipferlia bialata]|eukprot:g10893.t1